MEKSENKTSPIKVTEGASQRVDLFHILDCEAGTDTLDVSIGT